MTANIMSLGGFAVAIGAMVDAAVVVVEQTHKKLEQWDAEGRPGDYKDVVISAVKEVGGPSFFALLVIAVVLPAGVHARSAGRPPVQAAGLHQEFRHGDRGSPGHHARPSACGLLFTRMDNFSFRPRWLARDRQRRARWQDSQRRQPPDQPSADEALPPSRVEFALEHKWKTIAVAVIAMVLTVPVFFKLGSEFMPPLDEGTLLYMPTTLPGMSVTEASRLLQVQDKIIKSFPEVDRVFGKAGRVESATDPAPYSMMETVIILKPQTEWPKRERWYSKWAPNWLQGTLRRFWPDHKTTQELIYGPGGLNEALTMPGSANAWTMPIKARIDMLTTGVRTPLGIKVLGSDLGEIQKSRRTDRDGAEGHPRYDQCLCRAHDRRLLPGLRPQARSARAVWTDSRRCQRCPDVRRGRRARHHHDRRTGTLLGQRPLLARLPQRHRRAAASAGQHPFRARRFRWHRLLTSPSRPGPE